MRCATSSIRASATDAADVKPAETDAATLLDVADLRTYFFLRHGILKAVDGVSFQLKPHETLAIVGESGCGKSMTALSLMRLIPEPPGKIVSGSVKLDGTRPGHARRARDAQGARQRHLDDLPGADDVAQSGDDGRQPDRRGAAAARGPVAQRRAQARGRDPQAGAHAGSRAAAEGISASALRRHAPARDDRDGARLQSESADRRRADHRARRDHPGADPRHHPRPAEEARHRRDPDHARSRRGGRDRAARDRDVCGQEGGGSAGRRTVRAPAASLHARPDGLDPAARSHARRRRRDGSGAWRKFPASCRRSPTCRPAARSRRAVRTRSIICRREFPPYEEKRPAIGRRAGARRRSTEPRMPERAPARARGEEPQEAFPDQEGPAAPHRRLRLRGRRRDAHDPRRARRSRWSASPAAASPPSAAPSCV